METWANRETRIRPSYVFRWCARSSRWMYMKLRASRTQDSNTSMRVEVQVAFDTLVVCLRVSA